jgi:hypothetical protein
MICEECGAECKDSAIYCEKYGMPINDGVNLVSCDEGIYGSKYMFKNMDFDYLANTIDSMFIDRGYKIKKGEIGNCVYSRGSDTMNFLSSGIVKSDEFKVRVFPESENTCLKIKMKIGGLGMFAGSIGGSRRSLEYNKLKKMIKSL